MKKREARIEIAMRYDERYAPIVIEEIPAIIADNTMLILILIGFGGLVGLAIFYQVIKKVYQFIQRMRDEARNKPKVELKTKPKKDFQEFKIPEFPRGPRELVAPLPLEQTQECQVSEEDQIQKLDYDQNSFRQIQRAIKEEQDEWSYYSEEY